MLPSCQSVDGCHVGQGTGEALGPSPPHSSGNMLQDRELGRKDVSEVRSSLETDSPQQGNKSR